MYAGFGIMQKKPTSVVVFVGWEPNICGTSVLCSTCVVPLCGKTGYLAGQLDVSRSSCTSAEPCGKFLEYFYCILFSLHALRVAPPITEPRLSYSVCYCMCSLIPFRHLNQVDGPHDFPTWQILYHSEFLAAGLVLSVRTFLLSLLPMEMDGSVAWLARSLNTAVAATLSIDKNTSGITKHRIPRSKLGNGQ
jgi:hypothetical protein